ncbi:nitroreductase family protein [Candidatus Latescibacterota bacterium]
MRKILSLSIISMLIFSNLISAQNYIQLPEPKIRGTFMKALKNRSTYRNFSSTEIDKQILSEVLWAAYGVNSQTGRRTVGTAYNTREMHIYVLKKDGSFLYDADNKRLILVTEEDIRGIVATQDYVKNAPVQLIYVADHGAMRKQISGRAGGDMERFSTIHTGQIAQNVYLYCASKKLGTVMRDVGPKEELREKLKLGSDCMIMASQVVGYPGNN